MVSVNIPENGNERLCSRNTYNVLSALSLRYCELVSELLVDLLDIGKCGPIKIVLSFLSDLF